MDLSLARYYRKGSGWELVTLDDEELKDAYSATRQKNNELFKECLEDALSLLQKYRPYPLISQALPIAQQLFERKAIHVSLLMDALLKRKMHELRNGGENE